MEEKKKKTEENLSAEEYRRIAQDHIDEIKKLWIMVLKVGIFICAAVIVAIVLSAAWFASNKVVSMETSRVSAKQRGFVLESEGEEIRDDLKKYLGDGSLSWMLTADSNLQNYKDQLGISPDSSGKLFFYVIPNDNESLLVINCTLAIRPVMKDQTLATDAVTKIMRGHLLFSYEYTCGETTFRELVDVRDGTFQISIPDAKAGEKQLITLNWFWPYTLYDANNHALFGRKITDMTQSEDFFDYFYYDKTGSSDISSTFKILNQHYNDADQLIGDKVEAVIVELTAEPINQ